METENRANVEEFLQSMVLLSLIYKLYLALPTIGKLYIRNLHIGF